jgi:hypothetical protein
MKCDFCGEEHVHTDMMEFPHRQIKSVTAFGFVPSGFTRMARLSGSGQEPAQYWRDIVSRYTDSDWWALCKSCQQEMQSHARGMMGMS